MNENAISLLVINTYNLYSETLIKNFEYFNDIKEGDLILEITALHDEKQRLNSIGYLKTKISDWECIIETLDGREIHWSNCKFIKVTTELFEIKNWRGAK